MADHKGNNGKIIVTWDELKSRKVDTRLREQNAMARNREYARLDESVLPQAKAGKPSLASRVWNNSVFALAFFGLVGGVLAWACGASLQFRADAKADAEQRMQNIHRISDAADQGLLSRADADSAIDNATADGRAKNPYFAVITDPRYTVTDLAPGEIQRRGIEREQRLQDVAARDHMKGMISRVLAFGAAGVMIALCLAIAIPVTERNVPGIVVNGSVGAALGLIGGLIVAALVGPVQRGVASILQSRPATTREWAARIAVWGIMGVFLTVAPGIVMRNGKKLVIGLIGGLLGGVVGGLLFDPIQNLTQGNTRWPELAAMCAIGLVAGLATGVIENVAKTGWLRVTQGLIAGKQFILYRSPTFVGSGPDCQIYLFRDPKVGRRHAAIHIVPGGFELEDLPLGEPTFVNGKAVNRSRLRNGDRIQIGSTLLVFQEKVPAT
jgi:hypothetical protein